MFPIDLPVQGQSGNEPEVAIGVPTEATEKKKKSEIPAQYSSQASTPLIVEVPPEGGVLDLKLEKVPAK